MTTTTAFNAQNEPTSTTVYNPDDEVVETIDALGNITTRVYNADGEVAVTIGHDRPARAHHDPVV